MRGYTIRRLIRGIVTVWMVALIVFLMLRITGDPMTFLANPAISVADKERMRQAYGLDKPIYHQYVVFHKGIFTGDFGPSLRYLGFSAFHMFKTRLVPTVQLVGSALVFAMILGVVFGVISATRPDSIFDRVSKVLAITGQSMPAFWLGLLFILLFTLWLGWLPSAGGLDRLGLKGIIMPATSLGWFLVAANTRLTRSAMISVLDSESIRMLRAKGLPHTMVIWKHALKNASLPVVTLLGVNFTYLVSGALVTEAIFAWPGIGRLLVEAIYARDYNVVQTVVFFAATIVVGINILVDLAYGWLDPRIRLTA